MPIGNDGFREADLAKRLTGTNPANFLEAGAIPGKTTEFTWHFLHAQDTNRLGLNHYGLTARAPKARAPPPN
jgi:hypothetical protein